MGQAEGFSRRSIWQHDCELVTAQSGRSVAGADAIPQPHCDILQQDIAGGVSKPVIHILEAVKIEAQQGAWGACNRMLYRIIEPISE